MPTEFIAQNGAEIHEATKVSVTGCPRAKHNAKKAKKKARPKKAKKNARHHKKRRGKGGRR